jgi:hypothetical protein
MPERYEMKMPTFENLFNQEQIQQLAQVQPEVAKATSSRPLAARDKLRQRIKQQRDARSKK